MIQLSDLTLGQWLDFRAIHDGDMEYLVFADNGLRLTFGELNLRANALAKGLLSMGFGKGSHIGLWSDNTPEWILIFFACQKIGAVAIPLNTAFLPNETADIIQRSDMTALFISETDRDNNFVDAVYSIFPGLKDANYSKLKEPAFPTMKMIICSGDVPHRGMTSIDLIIKKGTKISDEKLAEAQRRVTINDMAVMQFTSGTTGKSKGVMLSHRGIVNVGMIDTYEFGITADDRLCVCLPLFHSFGLVMGIVSMLTRGGTSVVVRRFDPVMVMAAIQKEHTSWLLGVPTMFVRILDHPMFRIFDLSSLKNVNVGGAISTDSLLAKIEAEMNVSVVVGFGLTEGSPAITCMHPSDHVEVRHHSVGRPIAHVEMKILDSHGNNCVDGEIGEICSRGFNTMLGYYKDPEATKATVDSDGWLHTGDLGYRDSDGNYHITGRLKDMIIRGGENIAPSEIEAVVQQLPDVLMAQAVGIPDSIYGERVAVFVKKRMGSNLQASDVRDYCSSLLAHYKVPKDVFFIEEFPLTASGKVKKYRLREMALSPSISPMKNT